MAVPELDLLKHFDRPSKYDSLVEIIVVYNPWQATVHADSKECVSQHQMTPRGNESSPEDGSDKSQEFRSFLNLKVNLEINESAMTWTKVRIWMMSYLCESTQRSHWPFEDIRTKTHRPKLRKTKAQLFTDAYAFDTLHFPKTLSTSY